MGSSVNIWNYTVILCDTLALGKWQFPVDTVMTSVAIGVRGTKEFLSFAVHWLWLAWIFCLFASFIL